MNKLAGKVAVITGATSGIGLETAKLFAKEGAKVVLTGRRQKELDEAVKNIGDNVIGVQGDVANLASLDKLYTEVSKTFGNIDIIFANAGVAQVRPFPDANEAHFDTLFNINVKGLFFTIQKALPYLNQGSSIILNASVAASTANPGFSVYSATKAAVRSFARTLTLELKDRKIRINAISPGPIETPIFDKIEMSKEQIAQFAEHIQQEVPLGRFGKPSEIAQAALFLASDDSSYITGIELFVDGGLAQV